MLGKHNLWSILKHSKMPTSSEEFSTPEGIIRGWGTTVGNGIEGWAPGAIFQDTDAGDEQGLYINTGTSTTAVWVAVQSLMVTNSLLAPVSKAANYTVLAADTGKTFTSGAADVVFTLPATAVALTFTFVAITLSATTGLSVSPAAVDNINSGTDNKDLINTAATDVLGDSVTVIGNGTTGWVTKHMHGIWAAEA